MNLTRSQELCVLTRPLVFAAPLKPKERGESIRPVADPSNAPQGLEPKHGLGPLVGWPTAPCLKSER